MKPRISFRSFLCIASSALLAISYSHASPLYWDGLTPAGAPGGGAGTWDNLATSNWDTSLAGGDVQWNNSNVNTAVFSYTAGTVTLGSAITVGGLDFKTTAYNITTGANTLSFGTGNNTILLNNTAAATITGTVAGTGSNLILKSANPSQATSTLTFTGASAGGWSGTTTINAGTTLTTTSTSGNVNQVLNSTSGITINGGTIQFNRATNAQLNAISDSAAITVNGGGTFAVTMADASGANAIESIGAVSVNSGQFNFNITNGGSSGSKTQFNGLTMGSTAAVTFSFNPSTANLWINLNGGSAPANTPAGQIVGPWATTGNPGSIAAQTDYAVYSGGNGTIATAGIAVSAESAWTTASNAYTMGIGTATTPQTLGAARNITALRISGTRLTSVDAATETYTLTAHGFTDGEQVVFGKDAPGGLTAGTTYYVRDAAANTFRVAATSGGAVLAISNAGTLPEIRRSTTPTTLTLASGANLGTHGILNGSGFAMTIAPGTGGVVTLPSATSSELHVTSGRSDITISAPIEDNGAGVLTLVKNGSSGLTLSGVNTYKGGTVLNAGTLTYANDNRLGASGFRNITVNGNASLSGYDGSSLGQLSVGTGAVATLLGGSLTFATTTGLGTVTLGGQETYSFLDASAFHGNLKVNAGAGPQTLRFGNIGDDSGAGNLQFGNGSTDNNQVLTIQLYNNAGAQTLNNRSIEFLSRNQAAGTGSFRDAVLQNANTDAANTFVINTSLVNNTDRDHNFILGGANAGDNAFNGVIGNSTKGSFYLTNTGALNLQKADAGKWILSNSNTYSGTTLVNAGTLVGTNAVQSFGTHLSGINIAGGATLSLRNNNSVSFTNGTSPYHINNSATAATINVDRVTGTGTNILTVGNLTTTSTATTWQLNFTGANGVSLNAGTVATPASASTVSHTISNAIAGGGSLTLSSVAGGGTGATSSLVFTGTGTTEVTGNITQAATAQTLTKNDTGTLKLSGTTSSYTGTTTVNRGTLQISSIANYNGASSIGAPASGDLVLGSANTGVLNYVGTDLAGHSSNRTITVGSSTAAHAGGAHIYANGTGALTFTATDFNTAQATATTARTLTLGGAGNGAIEGTIQNNSVTGTIALTKQDGGTWILAGDSSYTGATNVNVGSLIITGSTSSTSLVTVAAAGTLGGTGTVGGHTTLNGTLSPGQSPGTLTFGGNLTVNNLANYIFEVGDLTNVAGELSLNDNWKLTLGFGFQDGGSVMIFDYGTLAASPDLVPTFDFTALGFTPTGPLSLTDNGSAIVLNGISVIPEPRAALLGGLGMLVLLRRRRSNL